MLPNAVFVMAKDKGPAGILETFSSTIVTLSQIGRYSSDGSCGLLGFMCYVWVMGLKLMEALQGLDGKKFCLLLPSLPSLLPFSVMHLYLVSSPFFLFSLSQTWPVTVEIMGVCSLSSFVQSAVASRRCHTSQRLCHVHCRQYMWGPCSVGRAGRCCQGDCSSGRKHSQVFFPEGQTVAVHQGGWLWGEGVLEHPTTELTVVRR